MTDLAIQPKRGAPYPNPVHIPHAGGRPSIYSHELALAICEKLSQGVTRIAACESIGISRITMRHWLEDAEHYGTEEFVSMVAQAEAQAEVLLTQTVFAGGTDGKTDGDWRPAIEWLKRRRRADYGDTLDVRKIDTEVLLQMLAQQAGNEPQALALEDGQSDL